MKTQEQEELAAIEERARCRAICTHRRARGPDGDLHRFAFHLAFNTATSESEVLKILDSMPECAAAEESPLPVAAAAQMRAGAQAAAALRGIPVPEIDTSLLPAEALGFEVEQGQFEAGRRAALGLFSRGFSAEGSRPSPAAVAEIVSNPPTLGESYRDRFPSDLEKAGREAAMRIKEMAGGRP